jgi:hypothetical protein
MAKHLRHKAAIATTANIIAKGSNGRRAATPPSKSRVAGKQDQTRPKRARRETLKAINERLTANHDALVRKAAANAMRLIGRPTL